MIPLRYRALAGLVLVIGLWLGSKAFHAHVYRQGYNAAVAELTQKAALVEAERKGRAAAAEKANDSELATLRAYRDAHPERPVRLCLSASDLPATPAAPRFPGTPAGDVLPLPAGDIGSGPWGTGPDVGGLLELLAARGDQVSAQLRHRQAIDP